MEFVKMPLRTFALMMMEWTAPERHRNVPE